MTYDNPLIDGYRDQIGRSKLEITTPALLLDLDAARKNIDRMAADMRQLGPILRPHVKTHKSTQLAQMQIQAGAIGVACATVSEALAMADCPGIGDVLLANQVVDNDKIRALAAAGKEARVTVAVDDEDNLLDLSRCAAEADTELGVVIEIDVGMKRAGVRSPEHALRLAEVIARLPALTLRGVHGYEGHCMSYVDREERERATRLANRVLTDAADCLAAEGHPCEVVSAGGTGTYLVTGANSKITEVQAGSYVLMDGFHERLLAGRFEVALTVLGTVISRQSSTVVLDFGRKSVSTDFGTPALLGIEGAKVRAYAEEHCLIDFPDAPPLKIGDKVETMADYAPTTVALHDVFHVVEHDAVTDIWPVSARASGSPLPRR